MKSSNFHLVLMHLRQKLISSIERHLITFNLVTKLPTINKCDKDSLLAFMQRISVTVEVSMNLIDFEKLKLIEKMLEDSRANASVKGSLHYTKGYHFFSINKYKGMVSYRVCGFKQKYKQK